jgi:hypothetical protein
VTTAQIMEMVKEYGRERYRAGKAQIRKDLATTRGGAVRNIARGKAHAEKAIELKARIEKALIEGPYL